MDDTQIYHKDSKVVDAVIKEIEDKFSKMVVNRGREHNFMRTDTELKNGGIVNIFMK